MRVLFQKDRMRFLDTMSLHICVGGITRYQKAILEDEEDTEENVKKKKTQKRKAADSRMRGSNSEDPTVWTHG